jgi:hypothetical protein
MFNGVLEELSFYGCRITALKSFNVEIPMLRVASSLSDGRDESRPYLMQASFVERNKVARPYGVSFSVGMSRAALLIMPLGVIAIDQPPNAVALCRSK